MSAPESALLVEVPEAESLVRQWRLAHDPVASHGIPAHVTALFPFRVPAQLDEGTQRAIAEVATRLPPIEFHLSGVGEFLDAVWLAPEPDEPFRSLSRALYEAFPDCPPYGGRYSDSIPHLTVAMATNAEHRTELRQRIEQDLGTQLPVTARATHLALYVSDKSGMWTRAARYPFDTV